MKPSKTFRLNKQIKTFLASITDAIERNSFRRAMIDAQLSAEQVVKKTKAD